jgi:hypothetical protein
MNRKVVDQAGTRLDLQFSKTITGVTSNVNKEAHRSFYESDFPYPVDPSVSDCQWKYYEQNNSDVQKNVATPKGTHAQTKKTKMCNKYGKKNNRTKICGISL